MEKSRLASGFWNAAVRMAAGAVLVAVFCLLASAPASAQAFDTGTVAGTVTDPTGAVVPHVKITITNTGTGIVHTLETDANGLFVATTTAAAVMV